MRRDTAPLVFGVLVSTLLAGTLVIAGLKAGITPGVSPLVILFAWGAFVKRIAAEQGTRFLNIAQVAGSAGMAVTAGVIFTAPLVQILYADKGLEAPPVDVGTLIILSLAGALIGFGFVGLGTKKFLTDPTLPAPEARACEKMIEAASEQAGRRPRLGRSLYVGLAASFLAPFLVHLGLAKEHLVLYRKQLEGSDRAFQLDLPFTPIYIGIGGLLTLGTALLVFGGSFLRLVGDMGLASIDPAADLAARFPGASMRWVGGGAMTVCVAYSLFKFLGPRMQKSTPHPDATPGAIPAAPAARSDDPQLVEIDPSKRRLLVTSIALGTLILVTWLFRENGIDAFSVTMSVVILLMAMLMVTLGAILSLQVGSSASPVSGTIFVTTLVLCLVALAFGHRDISDALLLTPLLVGACVAVCAANDSSQDYKTMQLCGVRAQDGFLAQILGLLAGCIVVPIVLYVAHEAYTLGSDDLPAPQGQMFATLVNGLLLESELPWWPILIGLAIGALAVLMEVRSAKRGLQLPSMALAVGIYLPPYLGVGILVGTLFRQLGERGGEKQTNESILAAAGLITGAAALELILGVMILFGFDMNRLALFATEATDTAIATIPHWLPTALGALGIAGLGAILWLNSRPPRR